MKPYRDNVERGRYNIKLGHSREEEKKRKEKKKRREINNEINERMLDIETLIEY